MTTTENSYRDLPAAASLGANHGYRIQGDLACLNAELAIARDADAAAREWALQLWACDSPYGGGKLSGIKVAEAALDVAHAPPQPQQLYAETHALLPAAGRDYSMVLVLASGQAGTFDRVHDFANYPARERFIAPYLEGNVGYSIDGDHVVVHAERVRNPRSEENLSGSLALELWALHEPYAGAQFSGEPLAGVELGTLAGQDSLGQIERRISFRAPVAAGRFQITLMLREWSKGAYVTRDFRNFAAPYETVAVKAPNEAARLNVESAAPVAVKPTAATAAPVKSVRVEAVVSALQATAPVAEAKPVVATPVVIAKPVAVAAAPATVEKPSVAVAPAAAVAKPVVVAEPAGELVVQPAESKPTAAASTPVATNATNALVSIQTASLEQLSSVKGLNKKLAAEILKARPFRSLDELQRVRGIGEKLLRKLREELTL